MPAKRNCRTYRNTVSSRSAEPVLRAELFTEEPIHHYPHPIPQAVPALPSLEAAPILTGEASAVLTQTLEQLNLQSQLLVDLLSAVNALTAAVLAQAGKA